MRALFKTTVGALLLGSALSLAVGDAMAAQKCKRMGFLVNDYGKEGPTNDAKNLLDKHVAEWAAQNGIAKYTIGKKDVTCELYINLIIFDEHTCTASANVCWDEGGAAKPDKTADKSEKKSSAKPQPEKSDAAAAETEKTAAKATAEAEKPATKPKSDDAAAASTDATDKADAGVTAETPAAPSPVETGTLPRTPAEAEAAKFAEPDAAAKAAAAAERAAAAAERAAAAAERAALAAAEKSGATEPASATSSPATSNAGTTSAGTANSQLEMPGYGAGAAKEGATIKNGEPVPVAPVPSVTEPKS